MIATLSRNDPAVRKDKHPQRIEATPLILDTDIGPDCDDAGALACAHALQSAGHCRLLAVTHCTSNPYGAGCADAINRWYGRGSIPVGTLAAPGFLDGEPYRKFNRHIAENYPNRYAVGRDAPDAVAVLRRALAESGGAVVCAIGPLINLSNLLASPPDAISELDGRALVAGKARRLVLMGGGWDGPEWNFRVHPRAAAAVVGNWPGEIWFSTYEVGLTIITGRDWSEPAGTNPVADAYRLYSPDGRMSWDQTAVWAAIMGPAPFFALSEPGTFSVDGEGTSIWNPGEGGNHRYLIKTADDAAIAAGLNELMATKQA